jgi:hypothetical protein
MKVRFWWRCQLLVLLVLLLVLAGSCTSDGRRTPPTTTGSPTLPDSSDVEPTPWRVVRADSREIRIVYASGGCVQLDRIDVDELPATVSIGVYVRIHRPGEGEICTGELRYEPATITLDSALADREIIGQCDPDAPGAERNTCRLLHSARNAE